jgi:cell division protein FtsL
VKKKMALLGLVAFVFLVGIFIVQYFAQLYTLSHQIESLNRDLSVLRVENQGLEEQVQQLVSLSSIESIAVGELKMVRPEANDYLLLTVPEVEQATVGSVQAQPPNGEIQRGP